MNSGGAGLDFAKKATKGGEAVRCASPVDSATRGVRDMSMIWLPLLIIVTRWIVRMIVDDPSPF